jgi:membrane protease YdiL (CAAX protease family)
MHSGIAGWVQRHQLISYFVGAYAITWVLVSPLVAHALGLTGAVPSAWHMLGALGPLVAALTVSAVAGGRRGLAQFLRSLGRWRVGVVWGLAAVFGPFVLFFLTAAALVAFGQPWPNWGAMLAKVGDPSWVVVWLIGSAIYGVGEEPGWRGFALPHLQSRYNALVASAILAVLWAGWHAPFFFYRFQFGPGQALGLVLGLLAGAMVLTCLYNGTGGSVLATVSWHVTWNVVNALAMLTSMALLSALSAEIMVAAVLIVLVWKPAALSPKDKQMVEAPRPTAQLPQVATLPESREPVSV